jgi:hypothetical protein
MAVIKARTARRETVRHITQLFREDQEELYAYAAFIKDTPAYVLTQLIDTVLRKDPCSRSASLRVGMRCGTW